MTKNFASLTGLRAVAAIMIFVYHNRKFWRNSFPDMLDRFLNEWHIGVAIFFVLSGFLITYSYYEKLITLSKSNYYKYILIRLARIYPIYFLVILSKYIFTGFPSFLESFMNFTLLKGYFYDFLFSGLIQAWSLSVELQFYILAPFIFYCIYKWGVQSSILILIISTLILTFIGIKTNHNLPFHTYGFLSNTKFVFLSTFHGRFFEFLIGIMLALHVKKIKNYKLFSFSTSNTYIGILGIFISMCCMIPFQTKLWTHGFENEYGMLIHHYILPLFIALFILGLIRENTLISKFLASDLMVHLGYASFVFYLIHISFVNNVIWSWHHFPDRNFILLWGIALIAYITIEKPIYQRIRSRIELKKSNQYES